MYICICVYDVYVYMCILQIIRNRLMNSWSGPMAAFGPYAVSPHAQVKESIVAEMQKVWREHWDPNTVLEDLEETADEHVLGI